ncbi:MAG: enoyl-CoA hydratase/isomerase family protein [Deltaproteobacteria bacterium]|nr:enoyl-CoA hydratase/isomerase family protein [Deltaproteobacteria bacterium]
MPAIEEENPVTYHREDFIGFITLNRPAKRNALNPVVWNALDKAIGAAEKDGEARVILLTGKGKSFCAGLDLSPENELLSVVGQTPDAAQKVWFFKEIRKVQDIHTRLEQLTRPTIALIHSHCLGAGLELVLCCDIRLCTQDTLFAFPEAKLGFITDVGGLQRLPRVVGKGHAREIAFRGHRFDARRAQAIQLVNDVFPDKEALDIKGKEMAQEIAGNPPLAVQGAKEVLCFDEEAGLEESLAYNAARSSMIVPSQDLMEAVAAFVQKRQGTFKGA